MNSKDSVITTDQPVDIHVPQQPALPIDTRRIGGSTALITLRSMAGCFFSFLIFGTLFLVWNIGIIPFLFLLVFLPFWGYFGGKVGLNLAKSTAKSAFNVKPLPQDHPVAQRVQKLARLAGLRTAPEVGIYQHEDINAFACGRGRDNSMIAFTDTALKQLNEDELNAIAAHGIAHIANNDMRRLCFAEAFQNSLVITLLSTHIKQWARLAMFWINEALLWCLSRNREYRADALAATLVGPDAMISALQQLDNSTPKTKGREQKRLRLLQINGEPSTLLATHPPIAKRITAIQLRTFIERLPVRR